MSKFLKYEDLVVGETYLCRLSGFVVLIGLTVLEEGQTMSGTYPKKTQVTGMYYNPMTGSYNRFVPVDYQLYQS